MKKYKILIIFLLFTTVGFSQNLLQFNTKSVVYNNKTRTLTADTTCYCVLAREKLSRNLFRVFLFKNGVYYDCIYNKNKFILIEELCK